MWPKKKPSPENNYPIRPVDYPSGICLKTSKGTYLLAKDGKRYRIMTKNIYDSWNFPLTVITTELALENYPVAHTKLGFRDGTLLNNVADGRMYLVSDSTLRHITDPAVFVRLGVTKDDCLLVSDAEINIMQQGEEIT